MFEMFPYRREVIKSLMACDLISLHMYEYARNFCTAVTKILGQRQSFRQGGILGIEFHGRFVPIRVQHIGVDLTQIQSTIKDAQNNAIMNQFKKNILERTRQRTNIISSVDRNHIISGIKNKFLAYKNLLDSYPGIKNQVCLV